MLNIHYQKQLLMEFEEAWMNLRGHVVLLKESLGKTKLLYHLDRLMGGDTSVDLLSDLIFLKSSVEIMSSMIFDLGEQDTQIQDELMQGIKKMQQLVTRLSLTLTLNLPVEEVE